jgi:glutamate racemase
VATNNVIGIFDSGVGGLTVLKELVIALPTHSFIYVADTKNCPYGPKGKDEITRLSAKITEFLIAKGCSTIVVACNTATAAAIDFLRLNYSIPFVGMEPAVKPAALATITKSIGVLATAGTFNGRLYQETTSKYAKGINVHYQIGEGLVELVEQGKTNTEDAQNLLNKYIEPMLNQNIDHLVLGCTHYPFFIPLLKKILPKNVQIVNPAPAVAKQTARIQESIESSQNNDIKIDSCKSSRSTIFYSTGEVTILKNLISEIETTEGIAFPNPLFEQTEI